MYVLVYQVIENNSITEQSARVYDDWHQAMNIMHSQYERKLDESERVTFESKYDVSCTIKAGGVTYDWSLLMV